MIQILCRGGNGERHLPFVHNDQRFQEMVRAITDQAGEQARYTATLMYRAWKGWSFADKKQPSPWLTFLVRRVQKRIGQSWRESRKRDA
jgi:hypothetical protein